MSQLSSVFNRATLALTTVFLLASVPSIADDESANVSLLDRIKFATADQAATLLRQEDDYTDSWSEFDIESRLQREGSKSELLAYSAEQARTWTPEEQQAVSEIFSRIGKILSSEGIRLELPDNIVMIKTTTADEGGASGYTRRNTIVISEHAASNIESLERLLIHELFHIASRFDPELRAALYPLIGFEVINDIAYPDAIKHRRLSNPDSVRTDHRIQLQVDGRSIDAAMVMFSNRAYEGGNFFNYISLGLMELEGDGELRARLVDGKPLIHEFSSVTGFAEQIGKNTRYVISPEEILAENFVDTLLETPDMPSPEIISAMRSVLKNR